MLRKAPPCGPTIIVAREKSRAVSARDSRRDPCQPTWQALYSAYAIIRVGRAPRGRRESVSGERHVAGVNPCRASATWQA